MIKYLLIIQTMKYKKKYKHILSSYLKEIGLKAVVLKLTD